MHILLIHQAFALSTEPGGTRHFEFADHFRDAGHRTTVVGGAVSYLSGTLLRGSEQDGIRVLRPYMYPLHHRSFTRRVIGFVTFMCSSFVTALRVRNVDIVFGTSPPIFQGLTAWAVARLKGVPLVFEVRDLWPDFAVEMGLLRNRPAIALARAVERFLYQRADQLVVNSPGFIDHVSRVSLRFPVLVPNGVDAAVFDGAGRRDVIRKQWEAEHGFIVLYAGAHGPANDLSTVIEAAHLLRHRSDVWFVLMGDGKDKPHLRELAATRALDRVRFVDAQPKSAMPDVLSAADAGIAILQDIPLFRTTYPNKVFDYMAAAKPVIGAIDGVVRQLIETAGCGICVPPGNPRALAAAIEHLADNRCLAADMGKRGRQYAVDHFDRRQQAAAMMELLARTVHEAAL